MSVGVKAALGLFIGECESEFNVLGAGMMILAFGSAGGEYSFHSLDKVYLKEFSAEVVGVVGTFLDHYGTGGMMRIYYADTVLDAGLLNDLLYFVGNVVEAGHMIPGLEFNCASVNCHFYYLLKNYLFIQKALAGYFLLRSSKAFLSAVSISQVIAAGSAALMIPLVEPVASAPAAITL